MAKKSLEQRVAALEAQLGDKALQEHFREQAELIDQLFIYRFEEMDKRWDAKLDARLDAKLATLDAKLDARLDAKLATLDAKLDAKLATLEKSLEARLEEKLETKLEAKFESKLEPIRTDLAAVKDAVTIILARLT